ncbi:MAG TPA: response regulator transcription factor [Solirubrobacterales bacterium]|nr:response regulator transcription factor [Solirubrobacterales bacterium]
MIKSRGVDQPAESPYALVVSARARSDLAGVCTSVLGIPTVRASHRSFTDLLREDPPSLALLEFLADKGAPLASLQLLNAITDVPVLAVVRDEPLGTRALRLGADAVAVEPIDPDGLSARIEALLRRIPNLPNRCYQDPVLELDRGAHRVAVKGSEVSLTPTEFKLLAELIASRGMVVQHEELLERVWGDRFRDVAEIKTYISYLRRKLGPAAELIENVRGVGYRYRIPLPGPVAGASNLL